jgi:hypothetical protein
VKIAKGALQKCQITIDWPSGACVDRKWPSRDSGRSWQHRDSFDLSDTREIDLLRLAAVDATSCCGKMSISIPSSKSRCQTPGLPVERRSTNWPPLWSEYSRRRSYISLACEYMGEKHREALDAGDAGGPDSCVLSRFNIPEACQLITAGGPSDCVSCLAVAFFPPWAAPF